MKKWAAFNEADWITDVHASDAVEALSKAQAQFPQVTRVELISDEKDVA
jgi:hypothetical protein